MKKIFFITLSVLIILVPVFLAHFVLRIKNINCQSQYGLCDSSLQKEFNQVIGKNLFITKRKVKNIVTKVNLKFYNTQFDLPNTLIVNIIEPSSDEVLPASMLENNVSEEQARFAAKLLRIFYLSNDINSARVKREGLFITTSSATTVIFPLTGDINTLLGSWELVRSWLKTSVWPVTIEVDLRYKNIIIRTTHE